VTLTKRADFLAANKGRRQPMPGFVLLVRDRGDGDPVKRIGYTVTKKIGGAVVRNRMKRRFRALARELLPALGMAGADHVLIGRADGVERDFALLRAEMEKALRKIGKVREAGNASPSVRPEPVEGLSFSSSKGGASTSSARTEAGSAQTTSGKSR
jgi:ribonuclease P protein component